MKRNLFLFLLLLFISDALIAQTVITRRIVSAGTGADESPRIVQTAAGTYAVVWARPLNDNESRLFGRLISTNDATSGPVKSNILGSSIYRYSNYDVLSQPAGGFVLTGTRNSDRQVVSRFFSPTFGFIGGISPSGIFGYNPAIARTSTGFLLTQGDGFSESFFASLNAQAKKLSNPVELNGSNAANGFDVYSVRTLPSGNFLILGYERNAADNTRAAGYVLPANQTGISALIPFEPAFAANELGIDAAFNATGGFTLFGHVVSDSRTAGKLRPLSTAGRPNAAPKIYPVGKPGVFARYFRVIALGATGKFVASWEEPSNGLIYLRVFNSRGVPLSAAFPVAADAFQYPAGIGDLAWDDATQTLIAVWTQYGNAAPRTNIWVGLFRIS